MWKNKIKEPSGPILSVLLTILTMASFSNAAHRPGLRWPPTSWVFCGRPVTLAHFFLETPNQSSIFIGALRWVKFCSWIPYKFHETIMKQKTGNPIDPCSRNHPSCDACSTTTPQSCYIDDARWCWKMRKKMKTRCKDQGKSQKPQSI